MDGNHPINSDRLRDLNYGELDLSVDDRDLFGPAYDNGIRNLHDWSIGNPPTDLPQDLRTHKDQTMAIQTPPQQPQYPWQLKPASNWVSGLRNADVHGINPKDALGAAKVPMHLIPATSMICQALCMDDGNIKYGPYNFRMEPIQAVGYLAAAKRHIDAFMDGQEYDSVTGKPHLGYALATIGIVLDAWLNGTLIDNRPVPGIGGQLLDALATVPGAPPRSPDEYKEIFARIADLGKRQTVERFGAYGRETQTTSVPKGA